MEKPTPPTYSEADAAHQQQQTLPQVPLHAPFLDPHRSPRQTPLASPHPPGSPSHGLPGGGGGEVAQWNQHPSSHAMAGPSGPNDGKWLTPYCGFCSPIDLSLITWCLPCLTYGQTHHRLRWSGNMENYEPMNTSCCVFCLASCFGVHWIPMMMQRTDLREKYGIKGNCCGDCCSAFCCPVCDLVQAEKEVKLRESQKAGPVVQQYAPQGGMSMPTPVYQPAVHK